MKRKSGSTWVKSNKENNLNESNNKAQLYFGFTYSRMDKLKQLPSYSNYSFVVDKLIIIIYLFILCISIHCGIMFI